MYLWIKCTHWSLVILRGFPPSPPHPISPSFLSSFDVVLGYHNPGTHTHTRLVLYLVLTATDAFPVQLQRTQWEDDQVLDGLQTWPFRLQGLVKLWTWVTAAHLVRCSHSEAVWGWGWGEAGDKAALWNTGLFSRWHFLAAETDRQTDDWHDVICSTSLAGSIFNSPFFKWTILSCHIFTIHGGVT